MAKLQANGDPPPGCGHSTTKRGLYGYEPPMDERLFFKWTRVTVELTGVLFYDTRSREGYCFNISY
jgi:hypothetical protein